MTYDPSEVFLRLHDGRTFECARRDVTLAREGIRIRRPFKNSREFVPWQEVDTVRVPVAQRRFLDALRAFGQLVESAEGFTFAPGPPEDAASQA